MSSLPSLIDPEFTALLPFRTDLELLEKLRGSPGRLMRFVIGAAGDEEWSSNHADFMRRALALLTQASMTGKLEKRLGDRFVSAFHQHNKVISEWLPRPLTVQVRDRSFMASPLVILPQSGYLADLFEAKLRPYKMQAEYAEPLEAEMMLRYMEAGVIPDLFRYERQELERLLDATERWGIAPLAEECEAVLARYTEPQSASFFLLDALAKKRFHLASGIIRRINQAGEGIELSLLPSGGLSAHLLFLRDQTVMRLQGLKQVVEEVRAEGALPADPLFWRLVKGLPQLSSLDLSGSETVPDSLCELADRLKSLNLSRSSWLTDEGFGRVAQSFPSLEKLYLQQNTQLTRRAWKHLRFFRDLELLDLSGLKQIGDVEMQIIRPMLPDRAKILT